MKKAGQASQRPPSTWLWSQICSWILRPPTAERKCTGHKRSQSKHTGEFHQIYLSHTITHQKRPKDLNPNTQVTTNCKRDINNTRPRNPNPNTIAIIAKMQSIQSGPDKSLFCRTKSLQRMSPPTSTTSSSRSSRTRCVPLVSLQRRRALLNCQCECSLFKNLMEMSSCACAPILTGQFCRIKCKIFKTKEDITIKISDQVGQSCY